MVFKKLKQENSTFGIRKHQIQIINEALQASKDAYGIETRPSLHNINYLASLFLR